MTALNLATHLAKAGVPIPCDLAFDLMSSGFNPDDLVSSNSEVF